MKIRITGTQEEFNTIENSMAMIRFLFDGWRKPQKGNNPKYEGNQQLLQYLEIDANKFDEIIKNRYEKDITPKKRILLK